MVIGCQMYQVPFNKYSSLKCARVKQETFLCLEHTERLWEARNRTTMSSPIFKATRA
jgi:hypothetical protein